MNSVQALISARLRGPELWQSRLKYIPGSVLPHSNKALAELRQLCASVLHFSEKASGTPAAELAVPAGVADAFRNPNVFGSHQLLYKLHFYWSELHSALSLCAPTLIPQMLFLFQSLQLSFSLALTYLLLPSQFQDDYSKSPEREPSVPTEPSVNCVILLHVRGQDLSHNSAPCLVPPCPRFFSCIQ